MSRDRYLKRGNLLWESSRMMLPEHREQLLEKRRNERWQEENPHVEPDEQELERMHVRLSRAVEENRPVTLTVWNRKQGRRRLQGMIAGMNLSAGTCRIQTDSGPVTVLFCDMVEVDIDDPFF
ncbi:MAG: YolD-like family protein [Bacillaceae bacterium]|nr:YolD-like family protein [Bacillaceae bacterium]